jgi:hypothetical protein
MAPRSGRPVYISIFKMTASANSLSSIRTSLRKAANQELGKYFSDRKIWFLEGDAPSPQLTPSAH